MSRRGSRWRTFTPGPGRGSSPAASTGCPRASGIERSRSCAWPVRRSCGCTARSRTSRRSVAAGSSTSTGRPSARTGPLLTLRARARRSRGSPTSPVRLKRGDGRAGRLCRTRSARNPTKAREGTVSHAHRHATGPAPFSPLLAGTLALLALAGVVAEAAAQAGAAIDHWHRRPPIDPLALALELADGHTRWPPAATPILIAAGVACALAWACSWSCAPAGRSPARIAQRGCSVPAAARSRCRFRTRARLLQRFGVEQPGLPIARAIAGGQRLYATWEDMQCDIWGPRKGKSSSRAIPTVLAAPGPRSRPRTSPTCTPPPAVCASGRGGCGTSIPSSSPRASPTGGGTRSPTSPPIAARSS